MNSWDEQIILHSSTKTEYNCTRDSKRNLMKILSAWWDFRSSKCWNLFLSVDKLNQFIRLNFKKMLLFKTSLMDESLRWTEYLAVLEWNVVEVHQGRKKSFDADFECMVKLQK